MKLTKAGEYAVRCVLHLSKQELGVVVTRSTISSDMDIPHGFLGKIAQELARAGIIQIVQGPKGGYRLLRSPREITLLDVVEAATGEIFLNECVMRPDCCERRPHCQVHKVWNKARVRLRDTLEKATFAQLIEESESTDTEADVEGLTEEHVFGMSGRSNETDIEME